MIRPLSLSLCLLLGACTQPAVRGSGDLGLVIERASASVQIIETSGITALARIDGLGDLSHASVVFSRDQRYAYIFGRDGGLTKVDLLGQRIDKRILQGGNSIGGAISQDGRLIAVSNYQPGGVKVFDAATLALVADIPATPSARRQALTSGGPGGCARPALRVQPVRHGRDLERGFQPGHRAHHPPLQRHR